MSYLWGKRNKRTTQKVQERKLSREALQKGFKCRKEKKRNKLSLTIYFVSKQAKKTRFLFSSLDRLSFLLLQHPKCRIVMARRSSREKERETRVKAEKGGRASEKQQHSLLSVSLFSPRCRRRRSKPFSLSPRFSTPPNPPHAQKTTVRRPARRPSRPRARHGRRRGRQDRARARGGSRRRGGEGGVCLLSGGS